MVVNDKDARDSALSGLPHEQVEFDDPRGWENESAWDENCP